MTVSPSHSVSTKNLRQIGEIATPRAGKPAATTDLSWWHLTTLVLWVSCAAIGMLGLALPYGRPRPSPVEPTAIQAQMVQVDLTSDPMLSPPPLTTASPTPDLARPPRLAEPISTPASPPMAAVASPSPVIAFPLPITAPARVVEHRMAEAAPPPANATTAAEPAAGSPPAQRLVHGQGEGRQPAPDYPLAALRAGHEGTVRVRFSVGENGRVLAAEASGPCPWVLLNAAAVRVVRERWRFQAGPARLYEVAIRFEIRK